MTTDETTAVALMFKWVEGLPNRACKLEYGYGICEVPWVVLLMDGKSVWSGTLSEFIEWSKP